MANVQLAVAGDETTQVILSVPGVQGPAGSNLPPSGTTNQVLYKQSSTDYDTAWSLVTSAMITDGTIVNGDINASAAIAGTKISPDFGSQNVVTTGTATAASFIPTSSGVPTNGLYLPSANNVAISTSGTGRLFVDASGNVSVGTATAVDSSGYGRAIDIRGSETGNGAVIYLRNSDASVTGQIAVYGDGRMDLGTTTDHPLKFFTNNSEKVRITSTGTVNIVGAGSAGSTQAVSFNGSAPVNSLVLTSGGNVGIGTSSPGYALEVAESVRGNIAIRGNFNGGTDCGHLRYLNINGQVAGIVAETDAASNPTSKLFFQTTATGTLATRMTLSSTGLGIGTTSPQGKLSVSNSGAAGLEFNAYSTYTEILSYNRATSAYVPLSSFASNHIWNDASGERARIDSSGRLLVGTSSAPTVGDSQYGLIRTQGNTSSASGFGVFSIGRGQAPASIVANSELGHIYFTANDGSLYASVSAYSDAAGGTNDYPGRLVFSTTKDGESSPTERMRINSNGAVGTFTVDGVTGLNVSTAATAGTATIAAAIRYGATAVYGGTISLQVYSNGNVQNTNNSYGAISDAKLKENIVDATSQWSDIKALQVRKYNFKEGQTHTQIGLVAQEVELVSPGLVSESPDRDEDGNDLGTVTKSVNYSVLYMKAVKALQEAMERIETLEAKVAALEA